MDPGRAEGLLELGQTHDVDVYELYHLVPLSGAAGFVPHHFTHDPVEEKLQRTKEHLTKRAIKKQIVIKLKKG